MAIPSRRPPSRKPSAGTAHADIVPRCNPEPEELLTSVTVVIAQNATASTRRAGRWRMPAMACPAVFSHGPTNLNIGSLNWTVSRTDVARRPRSRRLDAR